jgi:hypothetical protein
MLSVQLPIGPKEVGTKTSSRPIAFPDFVGNEAPWPRAEAFTGGPYRKTVRDEVKAM